jgi:hypothetical protein
MLRLRFSFIPLLFCILVQPVKAASLVLEGGLHTGGDELISVLFTSGSTDSIKAGDLLSLAIGTNFDVSDNVESRITFGVKLDVISASNGDITFTRYPVNVLLLYKSDSLRIGGGLTYHLSPELSGSGIAAGVNGQFDDALGFLGELDWYFSQNAYFGFRLTNIDYTVSSTSIKFSGNSVGVVLGGLF